MLYLILFISLTKYNPKFNISMGGKGVGLKNNCTLSIASCMWLQSNHNKKWLLRVMHTALDFKEILNVCYP